jgi:hypothetical protein
VDMPERSTARAAIAGLHGTDLAGRVLTVNEANLGRGMVNPAIPTGRLSRIY